MTIKAIKTVQTFEVECDGCGQMIELSVPGLHGVNSALMKNGWKYSWLDYKDYCDTCVRKANEDAKVNH